MTQISNGISSLYTTNLSQNLNKSDNNHTIITPISPEPKNSLLYTSPESLSSPPSFEDILSGTSPAPYSRVSFANFLKKVHSLENLEFLVTSNYFLITESYQEKTDLWVSLYRNFLSIESPKEVNIPYEYKDAFVKTYECSGAIPSDELVSNTMIIIKDLLRDAYLKFISAIKKKHQLPIMNENYNFKETSNPASPSGSHLTTPPQYELQDPGVETFSPLDNTRSVSPLSYTDHDNAGSFIQIPRSIHSKDGYVLADESTDETNSSVDYLCDSKKSSVSSGKSNMSSNGGSNKNSISEVSKKIAGKLKWRRLSSNSN